MNAIDKSGMIPISIEDEMANSFLEYSMSVIVARALPDARDGLKPVHRRILYAMNSKGNHFNKPYKKSASTIGEVLGSYHPHGDTSIYDALVRMAQPFSLRYPLIDGQGNFGSVDGDSPAAMRYTEVRLAKISGELLEDINKETVSFRPNYDESKLEPTVLPSKVPNLLINGAGGIAVGMTTNVPPHNLGEIIDGLVALLDNKDSSIEDLMNFIKGPDFPTAGKIYGQAGIQSLYHYGKGHIIMRAATHIEEGSKDRLRIIITELPYQVNKAKLVEKIAMLVRDKRITSIADLRDESDKDGMRVAIDLKRDANENVTLNQLFKYTQMQDTFGAIFLALVNGRPKKLNLKEMLNIFLDHRYDIVTKRTIFDLRKAKEKEEILAGLIKAILNLDEVVALIKGADSPDSARLELIARFGFSELAAKAILDMRLARLTGLEQKKIEDELDDVREKILELENIKNNESVKTDLIKQELLEIKEKYSDTRRTELISYAEESLQEDLIEREDVVVTISLGGYIKRINVNEFRAQRRGGKGVLGMGMKEEDGASKLFVAHSHDHLLFFTNLGRVFSSRVFETPIGSRISKGRSVNNLVQLKPSEDVATVFPIKEFADDSFLVVATRKGIVKKTKLSAYSKIHSGGIIGIKLTDGDEVISAKVTSGKDRILISTRNGMTIVFPEDNVRATGRSAIGVKGINLSSGDVVVGMTRFSESDVEDTSLFTLKESGLGKRTYLSRYRVQRRGGKGLIDIKTVDGKVVAALKSTESDEMMMINSSGGIIKIRASDVATTGRNTKGVRVISLSKGLKVVSLAKVASTLEIADDSNLPDETDDSNDAADVNNDNSKSEDIPSSGDDPVQ
ncbi:MAG: DNA gyrase subunit A [Nitrospinota bacterium]